jgi:hypothetical protein
MSSCFITKCDITYTPAPPYQELEIARLTSMRMKYKHYGMTQQRNITSKMHGQKMQIVVHIDVGT